MIKPASTISKVVRNGQLTIPAKIRKAFHIKDGDMIRFEVANHQIFITPVELIDKNQSYFFTKKWQTAVKQSESAHKKGQFSVYKSAAEFKKDLTHD